MLGLFIASGSRACRSIAVFSDNSEDILWAVFLSQYVLNGKGKLTESYELQSPVFVDEIKFMSRM